MIIDIEDYKYKKYFQIQLLVLCVYSVINFIHSSFHYIARDFSSPGFIVFNIINMFLLFSYILHKLGYRDIANHLFFSSFVAMLISLNTFEKNIFYHNNLIIGFPVIFSIVFFKKRNTVIYGSIIILFLIIMQYNFRFYGNNEFIALLVSLFVIMFSAVLYKMFVSRLEHLQRNASNELFNSAFTILGRVAELKDKETHNHLERVGLIIEMLLLRLRKLSRYSKFITDNYIKDVINGSILHDIGKIAIDDKILLKPGRLTINEYDEMKKHTESGEELLRDAQKKVGDKSLFSTAIDIAKYHHERWDGYGYPDRLSGGDIPLSARIMAVADVYDALISERPYKKALSHDEAYRIIKNCSGTHFDPDIVKCFSKIHQEIFNRIKDLL